MSGCPLAIPPSIQRARTAFKRIAGLRGMRFHEGGFEPPVQRFRLAFQVIRVMVPVSGFYGVGG